MPARGEGEREEMSRWAVTVPGGVRAWKYTIIDGYEEQWRVTEINRNEITYIRDRNQRI